MAVMKRFLPTSALIGACALGMVCPAAAQSIDTNSASYNGGYGRVNGQENRPVAAGTRDANGNRVIIDGIIQTGVDQSVFAEASASASGEASGGVGIGSGASAIGNNLVVITQGNYNTVIVNSTQINNGDVSASTTLNGGVQ
ncbi:MAG: holdfast anchoring protein HfaA [Caulobacteraceae bacterium]